MKCTLQITSVLLVSFLLLYACHEATPTIVQKDFLFDRKMPDALKIKRLLNDGHPQLPLDKTQRQQLYAYYRQIGFRSVYASTAIGQTIQKNWLKTIAKHDHFGLPSARIISLDQKPTLIKELLINYQIGTMVQDLDSGLIDFNKQAFKVRTWKKFPTAWLTKSQNTDSLLLSCGPADTNYRYMAQHLYQFADSAKLDTISFKLATEKDNKLLAWQQLQIALIGLGYADENTDSLGYTAALKVYQKKQGLNADGRIGSATVLAFAQSKQDQLYHAQISLDKLRQAAKKPTTFVAINLPSFELQFISNDTLRSIHRIIIGKITHATPELTSKITRIVSLPFWRVPSSIAKNEILPVLKRNAAYLEKEHMRIYGAGKKEIDPKNVRWKKIKNNTFPYQVEQDPGPWNSLGLIKFEFANQFSVYVHDTPNRSLFGQKFRSFSHGCMRAEAPIELGKLMLNQDCVGSKYNKVSGDSLQSLIDQQRHQKIPLLKAIPIFVEYHTVTADQKGLYFHLDLYQKERALIALFRSGNNG
jgi:murein L,D-transpeptidase YcbB/YkuD